MKQSLDTHSLLLFIIVMESNSLTEAAEKLAIKQPTLSHALERLRRIFNDPLLIRSGRSVTPTARAQALLPKAKQLLSDFQQLTEDHDFQPHTADIHYTVAANDFQCAALLPALHRRLQARVKSLKLSIVPSWLPDCDMIRDEMIAAVISPRVPDGSEVMQRKLFDFNIACFFNPKVRNAPTCPADFAAADYICPAFFLDSGAINLAEADTTPVWLHDKAQVMTNNFSSGANFLCDSGALAIAPAQLADTVYKDYTAVPFTYKNKLTMYLIWHKKYQKDNKHTWFRQQLVHIADTDIRK